MFVAFLTFSKAYDWDAKYDYGQLSDGVRGVNPHKTGSAAESGEPKQNPLRQGRQMVLWCWPSDRFAVDIFGDPLVTPVTALPPSPDLSMHEPARN